ncbi:MAG: formate dehydrogenase [Caldimonas sp.]
MKLIQTRRSAAIAQSPAATVGRRGLVVGVGVAGAAAVAAHALHRAAVDAPVAPVAKTGAIDGEGYRLTPHVLQYYETTKA